MRYNFVLPRAGHRGYSADFPSKPNQEGRKAFCRRLFLPYRARSDLHRRRRGQKERRTLPKPRFHQAHGHALRTLPLARDYPRVFKTFAVKAAAFAYQAALFRPAFGNGFGRGNVRNLACELRRHFEKPCIIGGRSAEDQCKAHVGA